MVAFGWVLLQYYFPYVHWHVSFIEIYGYDAYTFIDHIFGDSRAQKANYWIEES